MSETCRRGPGSFAVMSAPCRSHGRPIVLCFVGEMRELLLKGALELASDRDYEEWQAAVGEWFKNHPGIEA